MSIDISSKDHRRLKILADAEEMTLREFVLAVLEPILHPKRAPNQKTIKAIEAARKRKTIKAKDFEDLCNKLGI
jgi:antitoxin component of RelBE/YafQ-DinJ toxin-antitoxin module